MNNTRFKDGRLGIGRIPIFPLDVSGNTRIEGDLVLKGTIADASGVPIYFGHAGVTSTDGNNNNYYIGINKAAATDANFPLDVEGNVNINNGNLFINGGVAEFSNWTDIGETEESGIYRNSKVAIGKTTANHMLDVSGNLNVNGDILLNGTTLDPNPSVAALQDYTDTGPTWKDETIVTTVASSSDTTQALTTALNDKADKASPEFSGMVTIPDLKLTGQLYESDGVTPRIFSNWTVNGNDIYRPSGNVGIGATSPAAKLNIKTPGSGSRDAPNNATGKALSIDDGNNGLYLNVGTSSNGTTAAFGLNWYNSGSHTDVDNVLVLKNVDGENRVGIGTTSPSALLDVNGSIRGAYDSDINSFFGRAYIGDSGHSNWAGFGHINSSGNDAEYSIRQSGNTGQTDVNSKSGAYLGFRIGNTRKMVIGANGNVGIGSATSPGYTLDVAGNINLTGTLYQNGTAFGGGIFKGVMSSSDNSILISGNESWNASTTGIYNTSLGWAAGYQMTSGTQNTLIGHNAGHDITTGGYNVAVGPSALLTCTSGTNNIAIGRQALSASVGTDGYMIAIGSMTMKNYGKDAASTNRYDIAIGYQAMAGSVGSSGGENNVAIGNSALVSITSGFRNICLGHQSGYLLSSGYKNILIGDNAGRSITTGHTNAFLGENAGYKTTGGIRNIAIGTRALYNNTTSSNSIAMGYNAMYNQVGDHNLCMGYYAGRGGTSGGGNGHNNIIMGQYAGHEYTTGYENVMIGRDSGRYLTTGYRNVYIGRSSGYWANTGNVNTCIGYNSGYNIRGGASNTCVGYNAGYGINTGNENTLIGKGAGKSMTTGESNVYLGHNANYYTTTGKYNIAIGRHAGCANGNGGSEGDYKLYIGHNSMPGVTTTYGSASYIYGYMNMDSSPSFEVARCFFKTSGNYMYFGHRDQTNNYSSYYAIRRNGSSRKTALSGSSIELKIDNHQPMATLNTTGLFIGGGSALQATYLDVGYNSGMAAGGVSNTNGAKAHNNTWKSTDYHMWLRLSGQPSTTSSYNCRIGFGNGHTDQVSAYPQFGPAGYIGMHMGGHGNNQYNGAACGGDLVFGAAGTGDVQTGVRERMRIVGHNGHVGIGTTSPVCPLEVGISTHITTGAVSYCGYAQTGASWSQATSASNADSTSIKAAKAVWCGTYILAASDRRIKENIVDVPDDLALGMLRNIPSRYYKHIDKIKRGTETTIGFIAQEVKEVLPMAVSIQREYIPNEMRKLENISWEELIDGSNNTYKLISELQDVSGIKYRFYVSNDPSGNDETMKEVVGNSDNTFTFDTSYNNVFCYGKEVDDFHTLDKQKLFALNFSATQELDRQQQEDKVKIATLETENQELKTKVANLEAKLQSIEQRLAFAGF